MVNKGIFGINQRFYTSKGVDNPVDSVDKTFVQDKKSI